MAMAIAVGDRVKDMVTGFTGIVVCRSEWLNGCIRLQVQAEKLDKDGAIKDPVAFDEEQLTIVKPSAVVTNPAPPARPSRSIHTGGDRPNVQRAQETRR